MTPAPPAGHQPSTGLPWEPLKHPDVGLIEKVAGDASPDYLQVAERIRAAITSRRYKQGNKLPSTPTLGRWFGVSTETARQAVQVVEDEGLVIRRQGIGTFVRGLPRG